MDYVIVSDDERPSLIRFGQWIKVLPPAIHTLAPGERIAREKGKDWEFVEATEGAVLFSYDNKTGDKQTVTTLEPGYHNIKLREKIKKVSIQQIQKNIEFGPIMLKDSMGVKGKALLMYQVIDPLKALTNVENIHQTVFGIAQSLLCSKFRDYEASQFLGGFSNKDSKKTTQEVDEDVNAKVLEAVQKEFSEKHQDRCGVKLITLQLESIEYQDAATEKIALEISKAQRRAMLAETDALATVTKAEAESKAKIIAAQADADAKQLAGVGYAEMAKQMGTNCATVFITDRQCAAASSNNNTVLMPMDFLTKMQQFLPGVVASTSQSPVVVSSSEHTPRNAAA